MIYCRGSETGSVGGGERVQLGRRDFIWLKSYNQLRISIEEGAEIRGLN